MPTITRCDGFEHQTLDANRFGGGTTTGLFTTVTGSGSMSFVAGRTGGKALRIANSAANVKLDEWTAGTGGNRVISFYFRCSGIPSAAALFSDMGVAATGMGLWIEQTTGYIHTTVGAGTGTTLALNVADGNWHLIDYYLNTTADPWVLKWQVDGIAGVDESNSIALDTSGDSQFRFGHGTTDFGVTVDYDDFATSLTAGDYPIGPHRVLTLPPYGDGTHAAGVNVIEDQAGTDIVSPNASPLMDEWPANLTDYVRQFATGASNYAEVKFSDTNSPVIWYVRGFAALFASGTTANAGTTRIVDEAGTTLTDIYASDMSETALHYRQATIAVPGGGSWTPKKLNSLRARVGFSSNVATLPQWSALALEYVVPEAPGPALMRAEGFEHQTTSILGLGYGNGGRLFDAVGRAPGVTIDTTNQRTGAACLMIVEDGTTATNLQMGCEITYTMVGSFYVRLTANPSIESRIARILADTAQSMKFIVQTDGKINTTIVSNGTAGPVITDGNWHRVDFRVSTVTTTTTFDWSVDGVAQTQHTASQTIDPIWGFEFGSNTSNNTATAWYDDVVLSKYASDYPMGAHRVLEIVPSGDGTHNAGTNTIEDNAGVDIVSPNAFPLVNDMVSSPSTDYIKQSTIGAGNYAEVTFEDTSETTIWGVDGVVALFASGLNANTGTTRIVDSGGTTLTDIHDLDDQSETTLQYRRGMVAPPAPQTGWTLTALNGVKARVGFSDDVTDVPYWAAIMLQYAVAGDAVVAIVDKPRIIASPLRW